ncbi:hypothetical protein [Vibrio vulnificus YJ016]|uniref:Uncharacterized protein n=1 Tax=Vibrio vulnificus (strain YJ016) TaxID=196600 RepID=Q7MIX3_VIBVY|nr:hypothetical protein [Vibrio vulnificus YJ016]
MVLGLFRFGHFSFHMDCPGFVSNVTMVSKRPAHIDFTASKK